MLIWYWICVILLLINISSRNSEAVSKQRLKCLILSAVVIQSKRWIYWAAFVCDVDNNDVGLILANRFKLMNESVCHRAARAHATALYTQTVDIGWI